MIFSAFRDADFKTFYVAGENKLGGQKSAPKKFIVYKLTGSYANFQNRYPKTFDRFQSSYQIASYNFSALKDKEVLINAYDNSILYTDYILAEMIKKLKNQDAIESFAFTSGHGIGLFLIIKRPITVTQKRILKLVCSFGLMKLIGNML